MTNKKKSGNKLTTFTVPSTLNPVEEDLAITIDSTTSLSKDEIINQAYKFHKQGNILEAIKYYKYSIKQNSNNPRVFSNYGVILKDIGKLREAEKAQRNAIKLKPDFADAHSNLGTILIDLGKIKEAEVSIRTAIKLNPNFAMAYTNLGNIYRNQGKLEKAELLQRKAIELKPDLAIAYSNLGNILRERGKLKEAIISTQKAILLKDNFEDAYINLSIFHYIIGETNSALKNIIKANSINPKAKKNKLLLKIIQKEKDQNIIKSTRRNGRDNHINQELESNPLIINREVEDDLINTLYKMKARNQEKFQGPTYGNAKGSDYQLFEKNDHIIKRIKEDLTKICSDSVNADIEIFDSFFTIFRSGGGLKSHNHLNELDKVNELNLSSRKFSLVYYLSIGDQKCDEPGRLKLENPSKTILPKKGMIIIFPSERNHSVFYKGKKDRIIIGVNFYKI